MRRISLTQGKFAIVDDADFEWLNQWKWYPSNNGRNTFYAIRSIRLPNGKRTTSRMHREILGLKFGDKRQCDHQNHRGLDNRRDNLRICTSKQNNQNMSSYKSCSSVYKGVSWHKIHHKWRAFITVDYKQIHLGYFDNEEKAARVYDKVAIKYFGEFANLNFGEQNNG